MLSLFWQRMALQHHGKKDFLTQVFHSTKRNQHFENNTHKLNKEMKLEEVNVSQNTPK